MSDATIQTAGKSQETLDTELGQAMRAFLTLNDASLKVHPDGTIHLSWTAPHHDYGQHHTTTRERLAGALSRCCEANAEASEVKALEEAARYSPVRQSQNEDDATCDCDQPCDDSGCRMSREAVEGAA